MGYEVEIHSTLPTPQFFPQKTSLYSMLPDLLLCIYKHIYMHAYILK